MTSNGECLRNTSDRRWHYRSNGWVPKRIVFFDVETRERRGLLATITRVVRRVEVKRQEFRLGVAYVYELVGTRYVRRDVIISWDKREFTRRLFESGAEVAFAHNLNFDFQTGLDLNEARRLGWELKRIYFSGSRPLIYFYRHRPGREPERLVFADTLLFFPTSVEKLGEELGLPKLKVDFKSVSDRDLLVYCRRDVEIIARATLGVLQHFIEEGVFGFTPGSVSVRWFRKRLGDEWPKKTRSKRVNKLCRDAYYGGRVEAFRVGEIDDVYVVDINSLYPYVMTKPMPVKLVAYYPPNGRSRHKELFEALEQGDGYFVFARVTVNIPEMPYPPVPYRRDGKLIFPVGTFTTALADPELRLLQPEWITYVHEVAVFEAKPVFAEHIAELYEERRKAKKAGLWSRQMALKLIMNSAYGKFGERVQKCLPTKPLPGAPVKRIGKWWYYRIGPYAVKISSEDRPTGNTNYAIAAAITSYARAYLWWLFNVAGTVYYCDTDSLFTDAEGLRRLSQAGLIGSELGKLKVEHSGEPCVIWGPKDYVIGSTRKLKGVPKSAREVEPGVWVYDRFIGFRESLRRFGRLVGGFVETVKVRRTEYDKRVVLEDGSTVPLVLNSRYYTNLAGWLGDRGDGGSLGGAGAVGSDRRQADKGCSPHERVWALDTANDGLVAHKDVKGGSSHDREGDRSFGLPSYRLLRDSGQIYEALRSHHGDDSSSAAI